MAAYPMGNEQVFNDNKEWAGWGKYFPNE